WKCLERLRAAGHTLLVIDKYLERLIRLADRHTIIERGRVVWQGSSAELDADRGLWHRYLGVSLLVDLPPLCGLEVTCILCTSVCSLVVMAQTTVALVRRARP